MQPFRNTFLAVGLLAAMGAGQLKAQAESPVSVSVDIGFVNQYLWRGFVLNDTPSMQPGITVGYKNFSISSWSNLSHTGPNGEAWTEHDFTLDYTKEFGKLSASVGYINYVFPNIAPGDGRHTNEVYFGAAYDTILSPSITVYRDIDDGKGWYYYASIGHSVGLVKGMSLNPSLGFGLNQHLFQTQTSISNFDVGVSLDVPTGKVTFSPFFTRSIGHSTLFGSHNMYGVTLSVSN